MKKIFAMFAMSMAMFLTTASASEPPGVKLTSFSVPNEFGDERSIGCNSISDVAYAKVNIQHKDTLMYSLDSYKSDRIVASGYKSNTMQTHVTLAVVSQLRGEGGV